MIGPSGIMALHVQKACWAKLTQYTPLTSLLSVGPNGEPAVFDAGGVPEGQTFPYVTVGMVIETSDNTLQHMGRNLACTFHVWSQFNNQTGTEGFSNALTIANVLTECLDNADLRIETGTVWRIQFETMHTLLDPDGVTHHVPVSFRVGAQF